MQALGQSPQAEQHINSDQNSPELDGSFLDGFSDTDSFEGEVVIPLIRLGGSLFNFLSPYA